MKIIATILVAVVLCSAQAVDGNPKRARTHNFIEDFIINVLETIRDVMHQGIPENGIPPLDPFYLPYLHIDTGTEGSLQVKGDFNQTNIVGLAAYIIDDVIVDLIRLRGEIKLNFTVIDANGVYSMTGVLFTILPVFGDGPYHLGLNDVTSDGVANVVIDGIHMQLENLALVITPGTFEMFLENFLGGGDLGDEVNQMVSDIGQVIIDDIMPTLNSFMSQFFEILINEALQNLDISGK